MTLTGQITDHFSWSEAVRTTHRDLLAANRAYTEGDRMVQLWAIALADRVLEPIRRQWGAVTIHSWVRCPALNEAVGGVATSDHLYGAAADLHVAGGSLEEVYAWLSGSGLPFSQAILEPRGAGPDGWLHVSVERPGRPKRQMLR